MRYRLDKDGFEILQGLLSMPEIIDFQSSLATLDIAPGYRQLMRRVPAIKSLARSSKVIERLKSIVGTQPYPVRSIFFDKTPQANWLVPWHQDLTIAVREKLELPGYGPWSIKDGVAHVQPPSEILESMVTLRIHLDDCEESNGALQVIPGSHLLSRLTSDALTGIRKQREAVLLPISAGDALLMRPLLLHASSQAVNPSHRRVIHLEYATLPLPNVLRWAES